MKTDDTGLEVVSDGFSKSDSQDQLCFDAIVHRINTQSTQMEKCDEPDAIGSWESDGFFKTGDYVDDSVIPIQAVPENVLKEKNVDMATLKNVEAKKPSLGKTVSEVENVPPSGSGNSKVKKNTSMVADKKAESEKVSKADVETKLKNAKNELGSRKKKRRLPDVSVDEETEMVPSLEAERILFGEEQDEEMNSCEIPKGFMPCLEGDADSDLEFNPDEAPQSSQKQNDKTGCEVQNLSQEIQEKVSVSSAKENTGKVKPALKSCLKNSSQKATPVKRNQKATSEKPRGQRMNRVRVKPVQFFGTVEDKPEFGYLDSVAVDDEPVNPHAEFMFGWSQGYRKEYNQVMIVDEEHDDQHLYHPNEKDARESDCEDNSNDQMELPGPSGLSTVKKRKTKSVTFEEGVTKWGPTQEIQTQGGSKHQIKLGVKKKQSLGKQGKYSDDQLHSVSL